MREAWLLTRELLADPGSRVYAAVAGWDHPWERDTFLLADLIDITIAAHTRDRNRHTRYPRPTDSRQQQGVRLGVTRVDQHQVHQALLDRGHGRPIPEGDSYDRSSV